MCPASARPLPAQRLATKRRQNRLTQNLNRSAGLPAKGNGCGGPARLIFRRQVFVSSCHHFCSKKPGEKDRPRGDLSDPNRCYYSYHRGNERISDNRNPTHSEPQSNSYNCGCPNSTNEGGDDRCDRCLSLHGCYSIEHSKTAPPDLKSGGAAKQHKALGVWRDPAFLR